MNRFPYEEDDNVEILCEDIIEFQFTDYVIYYNKKESLWYADYYVGGDEIAQVIIDRDSIPGDLELTPEEFDMLQEALKEIEEGSNGAEV